MFATTRFNAVVPGVILLQALFACLAPPAGAATCESLTTLSLPNTTITVAKSVAAGEFAPAKPFGLPPVLLQGLRTYNDLPAFCRVAAEVRPAADSIIKFELWMPASGWNGKFLGVGNGGFSGEIFYPFMTDPLARGYATASTDTGHEGSVIDASFAFGHPEKLVDFGYRAVHEMTVKAKTIIAAYYGQAPRFSYWNGCSTGGRQGLMEAQRFPADFDGIVAGAPANYMTHLSAHGVWIMQALHKEEASFVPQSKYRLIHDAVLQACDARDDVMDGVLEDPRSCTFDPQVLECKGTDGPSCLTTAQVRSVRTIYAPATNPRTNEVVFPGLALGSELGWGQFWGGAQPMPLATGIFAYVVFKDPKWDYRALNFDSDIALADGVDKGMVNAIDPNLNAFFARGGKLLQYHGWNDPGIAAQNSINYYTSVLKAMGGPSNVDGSYRLFMAPGMDHCSGGEGPSRFDAVSALEQWVENKKAPERIIASRFRDGKIDRTRPLCPYPQVAVYNGTGGMDDAANFTCKAR